MESAAAAKRRFPRVDLRASAQVNVAGMRHTGEVVTLSPGGVLICGLPRLPLGSDAVLHLMLPGDLLPTVAGARVLYHVEQDWFRVGGTAFAFTHLSESGFARIARAVDRVDSLLVKLLFHLGEEEPDRGVLATVCPEVGLPPELDLDELRWKVFSRLSRVRADGRPAKSPDEN